MLIIGLGKIFDIVDSLLNPANSELKIVYGRILLLFLTLGNPIDSNPLMPNGLIFLPPGTIVVLPSNSVLKIGICAIWLPWAKNLLKFKTLSFAKIPYGLMLNPPGESLFELPKFSKLKIVLGLILFWGESLTKLLAFSIDNIEMLLILDAPLDKVANPNLSADVIPYTGSANWASIFVRWSKAASLNAEIPI